MSPSRTQQRRSHALPESMALTRARICMARSLASTTCSCASRPSQSGASLQSRSSSARNGASAATPAAMPAIPAEASSPAPTSRILGKSMSAQAMPMIRTIIITTRASTCAWVCRRREQTSCKPKRSSRNRVGRAMYCTTVEACTLKASRRRTMGRKMPWSASPATTAASAPNPVASQGLELSCR